MTERVTFTPVDSPSLQEARNLDANGRWLNAANHFFTLAESESDPNKQALYKISGIQMLINLGDLDQANEMLDSITPDDSETEALIYEKRAWIADYDGNFEKELQLLNLAHQRTSDKDLLSTINHFLGRAHLGLGNSKLARRHFETGLKAAINQNSLVGVAFALSWIARCDLFENNVADARKRLPTIKTGFVFHKQQHPDSGIESSYYFIEGEVRAAEGNRDKAIESFETVLEIQHTTENHQRTIKEATEKLKMLQ